MHLFGWCRVKSSCRVHLSGAGKVNTRGLCASAVSKAAAAAGDRVGHVPSTQPKVTFPRILHANHNGTHNGRKT